ncbi:hypothetical protein Halha_2162 [Halobacteroides halobius DSM 5150]|uniref:Transcriptional coactivator p15 (PC4) C-terminal domain-containing protein n=1 Tax=Halobacteroides halobius (strain ATCC 35273 / DSM 5150 / MD-1) TaxID=748449 RepID=L0KBW5_HALHC|nr:PC4/YdbC family ssDNA-binding protein [Halobacteroides halobius]AGB42045.1 hypothetical protein Halha_2162 [Halobacteroides halobius DSM 5150]
MSNYSKTIEKALNNKKENSKKSKKKNFAFNYDKEEIFGKINLSKNWEIQVTKTSWNNRKYKYEIRKWSKDGKPGKGVTCTKEQLIKLIRILKDMELTNSNRKFEKNDIVENETGNRAKVKKVEKEYLLVKASEDDEKWDIEQCEFIKKGRKTY